MTHVDTEPDTGVEGLDRIPRHLGRGVQLVLRTVVVDREFLIELLHEFFDERECGDLRLADHGQHTGRLHVFKSLAALRLVVGQVDHARPRQRQTSGLQFFADRATLLDRGRFPSAVVFEQSDIGNAQRLHGRDGIIERQIAQRVGGDAQTQPFHPGRSRGSGGGRCGSLGFRLLRMSCVSTRLRV